MFALFASKSPLFGLKNDTEKMRESVLCAESGMDIAEYHFVIGSNEPEIGKRVKASA
jgi:hypothetical protein